jgi:hypothetical protein
MTRPLPVRCMLSVLCRMIAATMFVALCCAEWNAHSGSIYACVYALFKHTVVKVIAAPKQLRSDRSRVSAHHCCSCG